MNELSDLHDEMLQLARQKTKLVIENQVNSLIQLTNKESKLLDQIEKKAREVRQLTQASLVRLGIAARPHHKLSDLMQAIPSAEAKQALQDAAERLEERVRSLQEINRHNQKLVRQALILTEDQLAIMSGAPQDEPVYRAPRPVPMPNMKENRRAGSFDVKT